MSYLPKCAWDSDHIRLPFSNENLFFFSDSSDSEDEEHFIYQKKKPPLLASSINQTKKFRITQKWKLIQYYLSEKISTTEKLLYVIGEIQGVPSSQLSMLEKVIDDILTPKQKNNFFLKILPTMIHFALKLPELLSETQEKQSLFSGNSIKIPLIHKHNQSSVGFTQIQAFSLLSNGFLCTFPEGHIRPEGDEKEELEDSEPNSEKRKKRKRENLQKKKWRLNHYSFHEENVGIRSGGGETRSFDFVNPSNENKTIPQNSNSNLFNNPYPEGKLYWTFPRGLNFSSLYTTSAWGDETKTEKLLCLFNYFTRLSSRIEKAQLFNPLDSLTDRSPVKDSQVFKKIKKSIDDAQRRLQGTITFHRLVCSDFPDFELSQKTFYLSNTNNQQQQKKKQQKHQESEEDGSETEEDIEMEQPNKTKTIKSLLKVLSEGRIEDCQNSIQIDFANKFLGGGTLRSGVAQEEIRFVISPELILSQLVTEELEDNEALLMIGSERFSTYEGYGSSFKYESRFNDLTQRDEGGRLKSYVGAIDAFDYRYFSSNKKISSSFSHQFTSASIEREILKFYSLISSPLVEDIKSVASGHWGCGVFGGNKYLKGLIQLLVTVECGKSLIYFTMNEATFAEQFSKFYSFLVNYHFTVGEVVKVLFKYGKQIAEEGQDDRNENLFEVFEKYLIINKN